MPSRVLDTLLLVTRFFDILGAPASAGPTHSLSGAVWLASSAPSSPYPCGPMLSAVRCPRGVAQFELDGLLGPLQYHLVNRAWLPTLLPPRRFSVLNKRGSCCDTSGISRPGVFGYPAPYPIQGLEE